MKRTPLCTLLLFLLLAAVLVACEGAALPGGTPIAPLPPSATLLPAFVATPQAAQAQAQSTLAAGQGQLMELALQGTQVSLNMTQAAATAEEFRRQTAEALTATEAQIERDRQATRQSQKDTATAISLEATQTQDARNAGQTATAIAQEQTATGAAHTQNAQGTLDQASLYWQQTRTAYPPTVTAAAATQAAITLAIQQAEREAFWRQFTTPLMVLLPAGMALLVILLLVIAYRRLMPVLELRFRTFVGRDGSLYTFLPGKKDGKQPDNSSLTMVVPHNTFSPTIHISPDGAELSGMPENPEYQENTTRRAQVAGVVGLFTDAATRAAWANTIGQILSRKGDRRGERLADQAYRLAQSETRRALQDGQRRRLPQGYAVLPPGYPLERIIPHGDQDVIDAIWSEERDRS